MAYDLELQGISKVFDDGTVAVDAFDIQVDKGEFVALLGPSGCGKTTTLRMIGGFEDPTSGTIAIRGRVVNDLPPDRRPTSMIFQNYALFPHMTVQQNVSYGLRVKKMPTAERRARVDGMLERLDLDSVATTGVEELSGGQKQRVALARGLVVEPDILLLDEPLGALDADLRKRIQTELRYLQKSLGITFVFVTHAQDEALAMADRIVVMNAGRIEQIAEPEVLYTRPRTGFVARFIGRNTIIRGSLAGLDGETTLVKTEFGTFHSRALDVTGTVGAAVDLVIPSEIMELYAESAVEEPSVRDQYRGNFLKGHVLSQTVVGNLVVYEVQICDTITIELESHVDKYGNSFGAGAPVAVAWDPQDGITVDA